MDREKPQTCFNSIDRLVHEVRDLVLRQPVEKVEVVRTQANKYITELKEAIDSGHTWIEEQAIVKLNDLFEKYPVEK